MPKITVKLTGDKYFDEITLDTDSNKVILISKNLDAAKDVSTHLRKFLSVANTYDEAESLSVFNEPYKIEVLYTKGSKEIVLEGNLSDALYILYASPDHFINSEIYEKFGQSAAASRSSGVSFAKDSQSISLFQPVASAEQKSGGAAASVMAYLQQNTAIWQIIVKNPGVLNTIATQISIPSDSAVAGPMKK